MKKNCRKVRKLNTRTRSLIGMLAVCILALITVQGSLAFHVVRTPSLDNLFSFEADGIQALLSEPNWHAADALNIVPGSVIPKDPQITNTGELDEWTAIKITFCYGPDAGVRSGDPLDAGDLAKVLSAISINWNMTNWTRFNDATPIDTSLSNALSQTFYYNEILDAAAPPLPADTTVPLFTQVTIRTTNTESLMIELKAMGGFQIFVECCAVQSAVSATMTEVIAQANFSFADTPG